MARLPYAAVELLNAVEELRPDADAEPYGDPDQYRTIRTIRFDKDTSAWLAPLLKELNDPRIAEVHKTGSGFLRVTFVPGRDAELRDPFPLADAEEVVRDSAPDDQPDEDETV